MTQTDAVVVYIDIGGIQHYIFGSNRLRENIGASYLVKRATSCPKHDLEGWIDPSPTAAKVIFAGGGKACLLFYTVAFARQWVRQYSLRMLKQAPGLRFAIGMSAQFDYRATNFDLKDYIAFARSDCIRTQNSYNQTPATLGLGVTVACRSTGLVAIQQRNEIPDKAIPIDETNVDYPVSAEIAAKTAVASRSKGSNADPITDPAMHDLCSQIKAFQKINAQYTIPRDFDDFGRITGKYSYLAVVHADGNGIGNLIRELTQINTTNDRYIAVYHALSDLINTLGADAMNATVEFLHKIINDDNFIELFSDPSVNYFPLRPIVYGGDDITFVCDARLAFHITPVLLSEFSKQSQGLLRELKQDFPAETIAFPNELSACAGITIFRTHYPFARAYGLCEELCKSAKDLSQALTDKQRSSFDWQIAPSGRIHDLAQLRQTEYVLNARESLSLRPVMLERNEKTWRTWANVAAAISHLSPTWHTRRNKLIAFQAINRHGPQATVHWQQNLRDPLDLPQFADLPHDGAWSANQQHSGDGDPNIALYFDVIELMEHYQPLEQTQEMAE